jgi:hypothetical protein
MLAIPIAIPARSALVVAVLVVLASASAAADDLAGRYDVVLEATARVARGASGKVTARITPKGGAHISEEAPSSLVLTPSEQLNVSRPRSGKGDLKFTGKVASFEVPFTAVAAGRGTIDATLRFYICTDTACTQQERKASLSVTVP